jgi:hypothetical protein
MKPLPSRSRGDIGHPWIVEINMDSNKLNTLTQYLAMGWALVPLHHVKQPSAAGHVWCSCRMGEQCKSAGKHPRLSAWQLESNLVRTEAALLAWPAETNWGLATGRASSVWALDVDPKNGGTLALDELVRAGLLQRTRRHWTGGGGQHLLYAMPADFTPTNRTGALPPGIDVRGDGGQIVLPPSVSGIGPYTLDGTMPAEVSNAFPGLLDLIRPKIYERVRPDVVAAHDPDGQWARYARKGVDANVRQLAEAQSGRNNLLFPTACRIIELCNAPWAELDMDEVYDLWREAGLTHPLGVSVPPSEVDGAWRRAAAHVGAKQADPPPDRPWPPRGELLDFPAGLVESVTPTRPTNDPFVPIPSSRPRASTLPVDNSGHGVDQGIDAIDALIASMLTPAQLRALPAPKPLINGIVDMATTAWLIGPSGSYKSFVALDWAAHVGLGRDWHGHAVTQGPVVYIVAEGATGIRLRVDAWERAYGPMKDVLFLPRPVQADERRAVGEWTTLVEACRRLAPALVIVDTQARVTVGIEENSATDMGVYIEQADRIKRATGACVLTVHHSGRTGTDARGSSALDGAQDAELRVERAEGDGRRVLLYTDKQKDQAQLDPMELSMRLVDGGTDVETGRDLSSLVVDETSRVLEARERRALSDEELTGKVGAAALLLAEHFATTGGTKAEVRGLLAERGVVAMTNRSTWYKIWQDLLKRMVIGKIHGTQQWRYVPPDDRARLMTPVLDDPSGAGGMYAE